jgi:hypothetical protein
VFEVLESETSPLDKSRALHQLAMKASLKMAGAEAILEVWDGETPPPEEKEREIKRLMLKQRKNPAHDPMWLLGYLQGAVDSYSRYAHFRARVHAVQAAIAVYLIKATTGQLPQTLPADLPKDPYSDKDFEYRVTERGFILRCRAVFARQTLHGELPQFEFQVK